ncbi:MAG: M15 family metallopeptidase [Hyphomicrobiaceae bacterium]
MRLCLTILVLANLVSGAARAQEQNSEALQAIGKLRQAGQGEEVQQSDESTERGSWSSIPDHIWKAMQGKSWHPRFRCPRRNRLAYLIIPYHDFEGRHRHGEMIVSRRSARAVLDAFAEIYRSGFRIARMKLAHTFGGLDIASMKANNTSAFNCRRLTGRRRLSQHSFGEAIDINPIQNPYVRRGVTLPRAGRRFDRPSERRRARRGMIRSHDAVVRAFGRIGWKWGGNWRSLKDYQHFSRSGH